MITDFEQIYNSYLKGKAVVESMSSLLQYKACLIYVNNFSKLFTSRAGEIYYELLYQMLQDKYQEINLSQKF